MIARENGSLTLPRGILLAGAICLFALSARPAFADAQSPNESVTNVEPDAGTASRAEIVDTPAKRQALSTGLLLLGGIIVAGTFLLALVVIWGNRARRLAQRPLPPVAKRDELWFLKPKKDAGADESHE